MASLLKGNMNKRLVQSLAVALAVGATTAPSAMATSLSKDYLSLQEDSGAQKGAQAMHLFEARAGESLRTVMLRWSAQAGWKRPTWAMEASLDFVTAAPLSLSATYPVAVESFIKAMPAANLSVELDEAKLSTTIRQVKPGR